MRFDLVTTATPEQVERALTDFTERRLETWSATMDPSRYEVREQGPTWAVAKEASPRSPFWVVCRYEWSEPRVVRWTVVESSYRGGGSGWATIEPHQGGSRVSTYWDSTGGRARDRPMLWLLHHSPLNRVVARMWTRALDGYAEAHGR